MQRFIVHWQGQNTETIPPAKVCAVHRDMVVALIKPHIPDGEAIVTNKTNDGECALISQGECGEA